MIEKLHDSLVATLFGLFILGVVSFALIGATFIFKFAFDEPMAVLFILMASIGLLAFCYVVGRLALQFAGLWK